MIVSQETGSYLKFIFSEDLYIIKDASSEITTSSENYKESIPAKKPEEISPLKNYKIGIVANPNDVEKYKDFLTKLLGAINIKWSDASVFNTAQPSISNYDSILIFGPENQHFIPFMSPITPNEPLQQGNQKILLTFALSELDNNNARKGILWGALKKTYSI